MLFEIFVTALSIVVIFLFFSFSFKQKGKLYLQACTSFASFTIVSDAVLKAKQHSTSLQLRKFIEFNVFLQASKAEITIMSAGNRTFVVTPGFGFAYAAGSKAPALSFSFNSSLFFA